MATVKLENVTKNYARQTILNQINFAVQSGEFLAVIGPSGCGKSTLLRLIAGLDEVDAGEIYLNGRCINKIPAAKRNMAMVFQNYALYPHMTAYENMAYSLRLRGYSAEEITKKVKDVAELLQITEYLQRKPNALSGGQRQRVAMGRAIVRDPDVFLFDEPLSNLDAKLRTEMRQEIRKIHRQLGTTCIYVTHDQTEAMTMADHIAVLNKGQLEQFGTPQSLYQQPQSLFVAGFTGHYSMNLLPGTIDYQHQKVYSTLGFSLPLPEVKDENKVDDVVIGIRPEHLQLATGGSASMFQLKLMFIDDMGADKLLHTQSLCGKMQFTIRVAADQPISEVMAVGFNLAKANLYNKNTGLRMGGWHGQEVNSIT